MLAFASMATLAAPAADPLSEAEAKAIAVLDDRLHREALYGGMVARGCATHLASPAKQTGWVDVALHEEHNAQCGGDPQTFPVLDRFRVQVATGLILWYDSASDEYQPFEQLCRSRGCALSKPAKPKPG
jgi:hypothetical protein